jgi:hypothetical protein
VGTGRRSGVSQTGYRSGFRRTWVCLGERGRRDSLLARRGESLFSQVSRDSEVEHRWVGAATGNDASQDSPDVGKVTVGWKMNALLYRHN